MGDRVSGKGDSSSINSGGNQIEIQPVIAIQGAQDGSSFLRKQVMDQTTKENQSTHDDTKKSFTDKVLPEIKSFAIKIYYKHEKDIFDALLYLSKEKCEEYLNNIFKISNPNPEIQQMLVTEFMKAYDMLRNNKVVGERTTKGVSGMGQNFTNTAAKMFELGLRDFIVISNKNPNDSTLGQRKSDLQELASHLSEKQITEVGRKIVASAIKEGLDIFCIASLGIKPLNDSILDTLNIIAEGGKIASLLAQGMGIDMMITGDAARLMRDAFSSAMDGDKKSGD